MAEMRCQQDRLVSDGLWLTGPSDFLDIVGLARHENTHSRMLAWLLMPTARHGLGWGLVGRLVEHCTGEKASAPLAQRVLGVAETERPTSSCGADFTLVIENKVDASEQPSQCDDLFENFKNENEPLFLFLTPDGRKHTRRAFRTQRFPGGIERITTQDRHCTGRGSRQELSTDTQGAVWMIGLKTRSSSIWSTRRGSMGCDWKPKCRSSWIASTAVSDLDAALRNDKITDNRVEVFLDGNWPGLGLRRQDWPEGDDAGCETGMVSQVLCGWLVDLRSQDERYRVPFTKEARPAYPSSSPWWPAYRNEDLRLAGSGRVTVKEYRNCLETITNDLASLVDEAVVIHPVDARQRRRVPYIEREMINV